MIFVRGPAQRAHASVQDRKRDRDREALKLAANFGPEIEDDGPAGEEKI